MQCTSKVLLLTPQLIQNVLMNRRHLYGSQMQNMCYLMSENSASYTLSCSAFQLLVDCRMAPHVHFSPMNFSNTFHDVLHVVAVLILAQNAVKTLAICGTVAYHTLLFNLMIITDIITFLDHAIQMSFNLMSLLFNIIDLN